MARARRIWNGVYIVGGPDVSRPEDCCVYLVEAGEELVLIDSGAGRSVPILAENIETLGLDPARITYLVATHGHIDHIGGLYRLKELFKMKVVAHELELPAIKEGISHLTADYLYGVKYRPVEVDVVLKGNEERLTVGNREIVCVHTPGHTPGSIAVYVDIDGKRVLFGQDIHGPFNRSWGSDKRQWRDSMNRLLGLRADFLCEGHFGIYSPRDEVDAYISHYLDIF